MTTITKNVIILILTVLLGTFSAAVSAQDNVHELFRQADYNMHHNRSEERLGTVYVYKRTWDVRKNKDGSYTYSNYYKGNQGDPWELSQVVNAEALTKKRCKSAYNVFESWRMNENDHTKLLLSLLRYQNQYGQMPVLYSFLKRFARGCGKMISKRPDKVEILFS